MSRSEREPAGGIRAGRLSAEQYQQNFSDAHAPLNTHQALVESDRCYFCYDAPCVQACPTSIDIPSFIRKIATGNIKGSAHDILKQNIMGAMCARVCPTEVLCEGACVRNTAEEKPVAIGALQRYATDFVLDNKVQLFERAPDTGKHIAVVGAGPAGLSCAHALARWGHHVTLYETRSKLGGLNEYGVAAYKVAGGIAQREIDYLLEIGHIDVRLNHQLGRNVTLQRLRQAFDAVFIGVGLGAVNGLGIEAPALNGVSDAVEYIAALRQANDVASLPVGRRVVVIGGGMTAIDIATQSKLLGAEEVTIVYRRGPEHMGASTKEQHWAQTHGVRIRHFARPTKILGIGRALSAIEFESTRVDAEGRLSGTGETFSIPADALFKAVGQILEPSLVEGELNVLETDHGRIVVDAERKTSLPGVWAGGDCVGGGEDLTVVAVEDGKRAAASIHRALQTA